MTQWRPWSFPPSSGPLPQRYRLFLVSPRKSPLHQAFFPFGAPRDLRYGSPPCAQASELTLQDWIEFFFFLYVVVGLHVFTYRPFFRMAWLLAGFALYFLRIFPRTMVPFVASRHQNVGGRVLSLFFSPWYRIFLIVLNGFVAFYTL